MHLHYIYEIRNIKDIYKTKKQSLQHMRGVKIEPLHFKSVVTADKPGRFSSTACKSWLLVAQEGGHWRAGETVS